MDVRSLRSGCQHYPVIATALFSLKWLTPAMRFPGGESSGMFVSCIMRVPSPLDKHLLLVCLATITTSPPDAVKPMHFVRLQLSSQHFSMDHQIKFTPEIHKVLGWHSTNSKGEVLSKYLKQTWVRFKVPCMTGQNSGAGEMGAKIYT